MCSIKGKILDDSMTLRASEVKNGAKVMLMASQGLHQGVLFYHVPPLISENSVILIVSVRSDSCLRSM